LGFNNKEVTLNITFDSIKKVFIINGLPNPILDIKNGVIYHIIVTNFPEDNSFSITKNPLSTPLNKDCEDIKKYDLFFPSGTSIPLLYYCSVKRQIKGNYLAKPFSVINDKISTLVSNQVPNYHKTNFPKFTSFLKYYYKFLENYGSIHYNIKSLNDEADIDLTQSEYNLFKLFNEKVPSLPFTMNINIKNFIKYVKQFYLTRGTENSYKFLFKILFQKDITIYYPKDDILYPSGGNWTNKKYIYLETSQISKYPELDINNLLGEILYQDETGFNANIENITLTSLQNYNVYKVELTNLRESFLYEHIVNITIESNTYSFNLIPIIEKIKIKNGGINYKEHDRVYFDKNRTVGYISLVTKGTVDKVIIHSGGEGYSYSDNIEVVDENTGTAIWVDWDKIDENGTIKSLELKDGGINYSFPPKINIISSNGNGAKIELQGKSIGAIKEIVLFTYYPIENRQIKNVDIDYKIDSKTGKQAILSPFIGTLHKTANFFENENSFLSGMKYLQDNWYYQLFSYDIVTDMNIDNFKDIILSFLHPVGLNFFSTFRMFTKLNISQYNKISISAINRYIKNMVRYPSIKMYKDIFFHYTLGASHSIFSHPTHSILFLNKNRLHKLTGNIKSIQVLWLQSLSKKLSKLRTFTSSPFLIYSLKAKQPDKYTKLDTIKDELVGNLKNFTFKSFFVLFKSYRFQKIILSLFAPEKVLKSLTTKLSYQFNYDTYLKQPVKLKTYDYWQILYSYKNFIKLPMMKHYSKTDFCLHLLLQLKPTILTNYSLMLFNKLKVTMYNTFIRIFTTIDIKMFIPIPKAKSFKVQNFIITPHLKLEYLNIKSLYNIIFYSPKVKSNLILSELLMLKYIFFLGINKAKLLRSFYSSSKWITTDNISFTEQDKMQIINLDLFFLYLQFLTKQMYDTPTKTGINVENFNKITFEDLQKQGYNSFGDILFSNLSNQSIVNIEN